MRKITDTYRSDPSRPNDFVSQGNGTLIDKRTGLQWMRCSLGQKWTGETCSGEAKEYEWQETVNLKESFAGHSDWRLPTRFELETLVYCSSGEDEGREDNLFDLNSCSGDFASPAIVQRAYPNTEDTVYWSSSIYEDDNDSAWCIHFYDGEVYDCYKHASNAVRLLRGGE